MRSSLFPIFDMQYINSAQPVKHIVRTRSLSDRAISAAILNFIVLECNMIYRWQLLTGSQCPRFLAMLCMVAFLTDIRLVFRLSLSNQPTHFDGSQFQGDVKCNFLPFFFITWLFFLSRELILLWLISNKTLCRPNRSVTMLVMNKSDSRCAVVRICHSYDYRLNWTLLSPITITKTVPKMVFMLPFAM